MFYSVLQLRLYPSSIPFWKKSSKRYTCRKQTTQIISKSLRGLISAKAYFLLFFLKNTSPKWSANLRRNGRRIFWKEGQQNATFFSVDMESTNFSKHFSKKNLVKTPLKSPYSEKSFWNFRQNDLLVTIGEWRGWHFSYVSRRKFLKSS